VTKRIIFLTVSTVYPLMRADINLTSKPLVILFNGLDKLPDKIMFTDGTTKNK
jgi:hypothetical protein